MGWSDVLGSPIYLVAWSDSVLGPDGYLNFHDLHGHPEAAGKGLGLVYVWLFSTMHGWARGSAEGAGIEPAQV